MSMAGFWDESWTTALVNHLWQSTVTVGVAWLLAQALRKNQARVRYWVWFAASVKFLLPFSLLIAVGEWLRSLIPAPASPPAVADAVERVSKPFATGQLFSLTPTADAPHHATWLLLVLLAVWVLGVLIVAGKFARRWWKVYEAKRSARPSELHAGIPVLSSLSSIEPGVFGIFRPILLLPKGIEERLTAEQMRAIVAHEMCHVRRRDNLTFALHMVVETAFWFHPLVWWIRVRLIDERERACDEAVVEAGGKPEIYAESILNVCKFCVESPVACVSGVTGADLKRRIVRIMAEQAARKLTLSRKILLGAVASLTVAIPASVGLVSAAQAPVEHITDWKIAAGSHAAFEVASIHLSEPGTSVPPNIVLNAEDTPVPSGGLFVADFPLQIFIEFAWKIMPSHEQEEAMLAHLPRWVATDRFVIQAKFAGNPTKDQIRLMMQSLLAERFKLAVHFVNSDAPVFALVPDKEGRLGPHIRPHAEGPPCEKALAVLVDRTSPTVPPGGFVRHCGRAQAFNGPNHTILLGARDITLDHLAGYLSDFEDTGRPIVDQTGLDGTWDISLNWLPDRSGSASSPNGQLTGDDGPSFFEALKDQLGLKLKPARASIPNLVIDHVEQPSPN